MQASHFQSPRPTGSALTDRNGYLRLVDYLETNTRRIIRDLYELQISGYDSDDLGRASRDVAALWERILKASDTNWSSSNCSLYSITEDLKSRGWTGHAALHTVRLSANSDKHEATPNHDFQSIFRAIEELSTTAATLPAHVPNIVSVLPERLRRRRMVCAVYEFFIHGESQYSFLAAKTDDTWQTVREIDAFQVRSKHTQAIEGALATLDDWVINPPELDALKTSLEASDHELWHIASFTASYQDVIDLMAPYQHDMELLPGLHREDSDHNVTASLVAARISGKPDSFLTSRSSARVHSLQERVTALFDAVSGDLTDFRLDRCTYATFSKSIPGALAADEGLGIVITHDRLVLVVE